MTGGEQSSEELLETSPLKALQNLHQHVLRVRRVLAHRACSRSSFAGERIGEMVDVTRRRATDAKTLTVTVGHLIRE